MKLTAYQLESTNLEQPDLVSFSSLQKIILEISCEQPFSRYSTGFQQDLDLGFDFSFQTLVKPLLCCLGFVLWVFIVVKNGIFLQLSNQGLQVENRLD